MPSLDQLKQSLGQEIGASDWITVTQQMMDDFAALTGDRQWIHIDRERAARESPFGITIAHGFLTLSLLSQMSRQAIDVQGDFKMRINYGFNRLRFVAPVPAGSRVRGRFTLQAVTEVKGGTEICWGVTVEIEGREKPAIVAEWLGRMY